MDPIALFESIFAAVLAFGLALLVLLVLYNFIVRLFNRGSPDVEINFGDSEVGDSLTGSEFENHLDYSLKRAAGLEDEED